MTSKIFPPFFYHFSQATSGSMTSIKSLLRWRMTSVGHLCVLERFDLDKQKADIARWWKKQMGIVIFVGSIRWT